jgi:hypothetical protein
LAAGRPGGAGRALGEVFGGALRNFLQRGGAKISGAFLKAPPRVAGRFLQACRSPVCGVTESVARWPKCPLFDFRARQHRSNRRSRRKSE